MGGFSQVFRSAARLLIPRAIRIEMLRLRRLPGWLIENDAIARTRLSPSEMDAFGFVLASHRSPLLRKPGEVPHKLQAGKERNVSIAAGHINGLLIRPYETFSYHRTVGRPSRFRGFQVGMELHNGKPSQGIGGGCCQVSNLLYLLALRGGMKITERFRHGVDLFPDHVRTVPFGCGATVFYNYADLRFENPLPQPVALSIRIEDGLLVGEIRVTHDPGWTTEIYEVDHRRYREGDNWYRENRVRRRFVRTDGKVMMDQEVAHNRGRILYAIEDDSTDAVANVADAHPEVATCSVLH